MATFIFSYRSSNSHDPLTDPDALASWASFLNDTIGPNVVDPGLPVFEPASVLGDCGSSTRLGGYSIISADDMEAAVSMAQGCPTLQRGGGVEVAVLAAVPAQHPAEQIRARLASSQTEATDD